MGENVKRHDPEQDMNEPRKVSKSNPQREKFRAATNYLQCVSHSSAMWGNSAMWGASKPDVPNTILGTSAMWGASAAKSMASMNVSLNGQI
jgi:hypothetical protein